MQTKTLSLELLQQMDAYWRAANYLSVGQIYLYDNPDLVVACVVGDGEAETLAQQPDASATITRTLFVGLAMIESTAIYCFVVSMILIFANPFWNHVIAQATGK